MSDAPKRPSVRDRFLDRVPLFGTFRRLRGWMRRNRGWIYFALVLAILFIVGPLLRILATLFEVLKGPISALLDNPVGRFLFYNLLAIVLLWIVWRKVRAGVRRVLGLRAVRHFLDGMNAMIHVRWDAAIPHFERVMRLARVVRLEDAVPEHRDIRADAQLKIAYCHLRVGRANEAQGWLLRVREQDILTDHVRRNHAELRALSYDLNDEMEDETVLRELEKTQSRDSDNRRVLLALRGRLEAAGQLGRASRVAERLVRLSAGTEREDAERDAALLAYRAAHKALGEGDRSTLRRSLKARAGDVRAALMLGDVALEEGDLRGALRAWSRAVSLPVFERLARLIEEGRLAGDRERALLMELFPYAGTLIVLAEDHRRKGEYRKARALVERVVQAGASDITVLRLYASCLDGDGDREGAAELYRRALSMSLG